MFLFFYTKGKRIIIPENRVCSIVQSGKRINCLYETGEFTYLTEKDSIQKLDNIQIEFDTEEIADDVMRSFFVACTKNEGGFYFG